jgi:nucleotide-binding universal stress UspA family protein
MRIEETLSSVWQKHVGKEFGARSADRAVATMTADMLPLRRILVPIDWSELSQRALGLAVPLAREHAAELFLLYVVPLPALMYGPPPETYLNQMLEALRRLQPGDPKVRVRHLVAEGAPALAILSAARGSQCDLIVMGTHARTGLKRLLLGSVAEDVIRKAPCPVLAVKTEVSSRPCGLVRGGA